MTPTSLVTARGAQASVAASGFGARQHGLERIEGDGKASSGIPWKRKASLGLKQCLDYTVAWALVVLLAPVFLLIAVAIRLTSSGPVFFTQERVGQDGRRFRFFKFRTMQHNADDAVHREFSRNFIRGSQTNGAANGNGQAGNGNAAHGNGNGNGNGINGNGNGNGNGHGSTDGSRAANRPASVVYKMTADPRVTRVGHLLRRTSLDELPQLFNVVRGDMSLVGPRPPVVYELEHYQEWHKQRLCAKPGITGLWQVSGRSSVPFDEMVQLDLHYIENRSIAMDLRIMAKTLPVILKGDGAY